MRSPAKAYITARGVESVSSPIINVGIAAEEFEESVQSEFAKMYGSAGVQRLGKECLEVEDVRKGYEELKVSERTTIW